MFECVKLISEHKDLVHDCSYDHHGKRLATCSSDQTVKIWDFENGQWKITNSWKTHGGSVWRVSWAHPEFGQIIATCSFDRTAIVWEEVVNEGSGYQSDRNRSTAGAKTHWLNRCKLVDSRSNVTDVQFGPKHLGLQLATCSQNGVLRIYEAVDIMDLSAWSLSFEVEVFKHRCSSLSWNPSRFHHPLIAVGCDETHASGAMVTIFEFNESTRKWSKIEQLNEVTDPVYDVRFAPNAGRSYHLLAVASKMVRIFSLKPGKVLTNHSSEIIENGQTPGPSTKLEVEEIATLDAHNNQTWRVSWNVTGTLLASSGIDGTVKLWKANYVGSWKEVGIMKPGEHGILQEGHKADREEVYY